MMTPKLLHYFIVYRHKNATHLLEDLPFLPHFPGNLGTENLENTALPILLCLVAMYQWIQERILNPQAAPNQRNMFH